MGIENVRISVRAEDIGKKPGDSLTAQIAGEIKEVNTKYGKRYLIPLSHTSGEYEFYAKERDVKVVAKNYGKKLKDYLGKEVKLVLMKYEYEKDGVRNEGMTVRLETV